MARGWIGGVNSGYQRVGLVWERLHDHGWGMVGFGEEREVSDELEGCAGSSVRWSSGAPAIVAWPWRRRQRE